MPESETQTRNLLEQFVAELINQQDWLRGFLLGPVRRPVVAAIRSDLGLVRENAPAEPVGPDVPEEVAESPRITAYREAMERGEEIDRAATLAALADCFAAIEALISIGETLVEEGGEEAGAEATHHLVNLLLVNYIRLRWPRLFKIGQLVGFVEEFGSVNARDNTVSSSEKIYFDRWGKLLGGGWGYLEETFGPLDTERDAKRWSDFVFTAVAGLLAWQGNKEAGQGETFLPSFLATKNIIYGWEAGPGSTTPVADALAARAFSVSFESRRESSEEEDTASLDVTLLLVPREHGGPGLLVSLGTGGVLDFKVSKNWVLKIASSVPGAFDFLVRRRFDSLDATDARGAFEPTLDVTLKPAEPSRGGPQPATDGGLESLPAAGGTGAPRDKYAFPDRQGTRLELGGATFAGGVSRSEGRLEVVLGESAFVISTGESDGFVATIMPGEKAAPSGAGGGGGARETRIALSLGLGFSTERGFYLAGGSGLQAVVPVGKSVGPVTVQQVVVRLKPESETPPKRLSLEVSAGLSARLGPVTATVDQIGLRARIPLERTDGNYDLSVGFKPPTGVGLKIDASAVSGGGFLFYDSERSQYGGVVQLELKSGLSLKAIGLISTRLPGGEKGFSLVVIITAEGFRPVQLGLGFMLTGVGGLLAVNRTFDEEAVRAGIKSHALERALFPPDPVSNAPQIISALDKFFPAQKGSYLLGVLVQIKWGLSGPLKMELALILELGRRTRLIVLGHLSLKLPREENDLVRLHMDAVGVIDFDQGTAALDAALYDSRLFKKFVLTGQMAMRLRWGSSPQFALSVGGFHPAFKPPPGFPALERLALSLSESDDFRLRCECYYALTSNTLQFGARAELLARGGGFSIYGEIGFDVLIQFDPFTFVADFRASVQLKRGSRNLFKVKVAGSLSGPRPLHVKGRATFEIFWCDFSVGFSKTLLSGDPPPPPPPVAVMPLLREALSDARNWAGELPEGERRLVTLRERRREGEVSLHPLGRLSVKQSVVPLGLKIAKFGPSLPADTTLFQISSVSVGGAPFEGAKLDRVKDYFASSEFLEMTDDEKLAAPAFESLTAGFTLKSESFFLPADADILEVPAVSYETYIIVDKTQRAQEPKQKQALNPGFLERQLLFGAAARSPARRTGAARFSVGVTKNELRKPLWAVVSPPGKGGAGEADEVLGTFESYAEAFQEMKQRQQRGPGRGRGLRIERRFESNE